MPLPDLDLDSLEKVVLEKCDCFVSLGVWPRVEQLDYRSWLSNYESDIDRRYALHLLNGFTYYNSELCVALLSGAIHRQSVVYSTRDSMAEAVSSWSGHLNNTVFVPVEGEYPNVTDSGPQLARAVRKQLQIPEQYFQNLASLITSILNNSRIPKNVVFIDDFVGSGEQILAMNQKPRMSTIPEVLLKESGCEVSYACLVATSYGIDRVKSRLPDLRIDAAHIVDDTNSVVSPSSRIWPKELYSGVNDFLLRSSRRAGIHDEDRLGFHELALALAFDQTIPDATLPIFRHGVNWKPLMRSI